jgi:predicted nuclease of predicted toxin-antitoxin system
MKLIVDMNLSPGWVRLLRNAGHEAEHWSNIGDVKATDSHIMTSRRSRELSSSRTTSTSAPSSPLPVQTDQA